MNFYNEIDPHAADWLRSLIKEGLIPNGIVDTRSIEDIVPLELAGFTQCHFFCGIGGWPLALRLAGVPDTKPLWTGSCPCQPFSAAGEGKGFADERHLWPAWFHLIRQCRPRLVIGEQVASKGGLEWLDSLSADLEGSGYAIGANDLCAAGFGAVHIRQRLYFAAVADADDNGPQRGLRGWQNPGWSHQSGQAGRGGTVDHCGLADADCDERREVGVCGSRQTLEPDGVGAATEPSRNCGTSRMGDTQRDVSGWRPGEASGPEGGGRGVEEPGDHRFVDADQGVSYWLEHADKDGCKPRDGIRPLSAQQDTEHDGGALWPLPCRDGRIRFTEPGLFPLAAKLPAGLGSMSSEGRALAALAGLDAQSLKAAKNYRVEALRGYGNAIHIGTARAFIEALLCP